MHRVELTTLLNIAKGVIVKIEKRENMPVDSAGNSADMVTDFGASVNRMNEGRLYQHYMGGACRDVRKSLQCIINRANVTSYDDFMMIDEAARNKAYDFLVEFYKLVSPNQHAKYTALPQERRMPHLYRCLKEKVRIFSPINFTKHPLDAIDEIEEFCPPTYGQVSYVGNSGIRCTTVDKVRIAPLYIMLLEKIADDWSATSYGRFQHFGILSPMTKSDKFTRPYRDSPVRFTGETEVRLLTGICGQDTIAEILDRSNNPNTLRHMSYKLLTADQPTNINRLVDRQLIPYGNNKPLQLFRHNLFCFGIKAVYESETCTYTYQHQG